MVASTVGGPPARPALHTGRLTAHPPFLENHGVQSWAIGTTGSRPLGRLSWSGRTGAYEIPFLKMLDLRENTVSYEARDLD